MITTYLYSLGSVVIVSLVSLIGIITLSLRVDWLQRWLFVLVSIAVGALLGDAFIHLIPEAFEATSSASLVSLAIIGGIVAFFILEKALHWHHQHKLDEEKEVQHPIGPMILISDGLHNFIDGLIIGASYLVSVEVGIATTLAVILHEIPQEIGDFGVLLYAGYTKAKAILLNLVSAGAAVVGTVVALLIGERIELFALWILPIAAGGFIYVAISDLMPELHKTKRPRYSILQVVAILVGVGAMVILLQLEA